ncbi:MAG: 16S rRNA processing protein RimM [Bacteroidales bacterium]|nr:16S rRNA processing protein RimM [Candidatus Liminaster caballi]
MIKEDQLIEIGVITKVHGLRGEMNVNISNPVFDEVSRCPYIVCCIDGIFVPFYIESYRWKGNASILLMLDGINDVVKAGQFCGLTIYFDRKCFTRKEEEAYDAEAEEEQGLIGYMVSDVTAGPLGPITDINDQTANVLFIIDHNGTELLVPAADELIDSIDDDNRTIIMNLPVGLVNLDEAESEE